MSVVDRRRLLIDLGGFKQADFVKKLDVWKIIIKTKSSLKQFTLVVLLL